MGTLNPSFQSKLNALVKEYIESLPDGDLDWEEYYTTPKYHAFRELELFYRYFGFQFPIKDEED